MKVRAAVDLFTPGRLMVLLALLLGACRPGVPVVDTGETPPTQEGTIAGTVRGPMNSAPVENRLVTATRLADGAVFEARTNGVGGYSIKVPPGRYKLSVTLQPQEQVTQQPDEVQINPSDVDAGRDFVIATGR